MSEQSGGGPITREQVERAIPESTACNAHGVCKALGELWYRREDVPEDVRAGWGAIGYNDLTAALTRWRDELAAAEPVRRVARWDAERQRYMLTPPATTSHQYNPSTTDRETAIAWGYEIEGGPASAPAEDSPERLRERREALGWSLEEAAEKARWHIDDIHALEGVCPVRTGVCGRCPLARVDYAAALSAEEARLARDEPERPSPRFKVGDRVRMTRSDDDKGFVVTRVHWLGDGWACENARGGGVMERMLMAVPASPPAPEVVDVPQPIVKRLRSAEAQWCRGETVMRIEVDESGYVYAPLALLRAMLEAINAQQEGAS